jgi:hypothetical protein
VTIDLIRWLMQSEAMDRPDIHDSKAADNPLQKARIGVAKGEFMVPDSFFEPLPGELLKEFAGQVAEPLFGSV